MPQSGDQFGSYRLVSSLGTGGFAEVWLGQHATMGRQAAVKILSVQLPTDEERTNFLKEARFLAGLDHPNIVRVLDCGVQGETPFLVLEYAPNGTLRERHPKGSRLALDVIVNYVKQIAAGLQYAHDRRLIHRDIKPENMLLGRNNEILLGDFGVALAMHSISYMKTQAVKGTLSYMAPEQLEGKAAPASDQYSLGVMVYEWLSGSLPFAGTFLEIRLQQQSKPPQLRSRVPSISPALEQVVLTALSEDLNGRFPDVQKFADALELAVNSPNTPVVVKNAPLQNVPVGAFSPPSPNNPPIQIAPPVVPSPILGNNPIIQNIPPPAAKPAVPNTPPVQNIPPVGPANNPLAQNPPPGGPSPIAPINQVPPITPIGGNSPLILKNSAGGNNTPYNAPTVQAQPKLPTLDSSYQTPSTTGQRKSKPPVNRNFWKNEKNRLFVIGGAIFDLIFALVTGHLFSGAAAWNTTALCFLMALGLRVVCAWITQKVMAQFLVVVLAVYWAIGSWFLVAEIYWAFHFEAISPYIIAGFVLVVGLVVQMRYANGKR